MNVRKPVDYGAMYRELSAILAQNLPQMDEVYAIGKAISQRPEKGAAVAAAEFLQANFPDRTGFSPRNVRRMRDFYRTYENDQTLLRLAMKIGWTLNVVIMEAELTRDARKWYLEQAQGQHWSKKELVEMIRRKESRDEVNGKYCGAGQHRKRLQCIGRSARTNAFGYYKSWHAAVCMLLLS